MAENNPIATIWNHLRHPIQSIRSNLTQGANEWREHPIQEALQRLIGVGTGLATANPGLGRAANSAADRFFSWLNNRGNNDFGPASGLQGITSPQGSDQSPISGMLGIPDYAHGQIPQAAPSNSGSGGNMGMGSMGGGMAGITSPNNSHGSPQSQLAQMLGLTNYQGNSSDNGLPGITSPVPEGQGPNAGTHATEGQGQTANQIIGDNLQSISNMILNGSGGSHGNGGFSGGPSFGYSGDTASGAHGTIGSGARQASMEGVQAMLGAGLGKRPLMPFHEINDERAQARAAGMSLAQYRASLGA
jgi:hypothetical protein